MLLYIFIYLYSIYFHCSFIFPLPDRCFYAFDYFSTFHMLDFSLYFGRDISYLLTSVPTMPYHSFIISYSSWSSLRRNLMLGLYALLFTYASIFCFLSNACGNRKAITDMARTRYAPWGFVMHFILKRCFPASYIIKRLAPTFSWLYEILSRLSDMPRSGRIRYKVFR